MTEILGKIIYILTPSKQWKNNCPLYRHMTLKSRSWFGTDTKMWRG